MPVDRMCELFALLQGAAEQIGLQCRRHGELIGRRGCSPMVGAGSSRRSSCSRTSVEETFGIAIRQADRPMSQRRRRPVPRCAQRDREVLHARVARAQEAGEFAQHASQRKQQRLGALALRTRIRSARRTSPAAGRPAADRRRAPIKRSRKLTELRSETLRSPHRAAAPAASRSCARPPYAARCAISGASISSAIGRLRMRSCSACGEW